MKVIVTARDGNKNPECFCRDLEMTPEEYEILHEVSLHIKQETGVDYLTAYIHEI